jgi:hypothetical protein
MTTELWVVTKQGEDVVIEFTDHPGVTIVLQPLDVVNLVTALVATVIDSP